MGAAGAAEEQGAGEEQAALGALGRAAPAGLAAWEAWAKAGWGSEGEGSVVTCRVHHSWQSCNADVILSHEGHNRARANVSATLTVA